MKLFQIRLKKWLGPGTPSEGVVREEDPVKAVLAFSDPTSSAFSGRLRPMTDFWHPYRLPKQTDFEVREIGVGNEYGTSYAERLRDPVTNNADLPSAEEAECRRFLEDRIVVRVMNGGGFVSKLVYAAKLYLAKWLRQVAQMLDDSADQVSRATVVDLVEP